MADVSKIKLPSQEVVNIKDSRVVSDAIAYIGDSQGSAQYIDEGGNIVDLSDYAKKTWVDAKGYLTAHQTLKTINNESIVGTGNIVISGGSGGSGEANVIEAITFNGSAVPVTNKTAAITVTIPAAVTESTVSGWGFTKNAGTLTGVTFNGTSATVTNGVAAITGSFLPTTGGTLTGTIDATGWSIPTDGAAQFSSIQGKGSNRLNIGTTGNSSYIFLRDDTYLANADLSGGASTSSSSSTNWDITKAGVATFSSVGVGGTSSQFLKADGSVDSTSYATSSALSSLSGRVETLENNTSSGITGVSFNGTAATVNSYGVAEILYAIPSKTSDLTNDSGFKKITISSSEPTSSDGSNGDIWFVI